MKVEQLQVLLSTHGLKVEKIANTESNMGFSAPYVLAAQLRAEIISEPNIRKAARAMSDRQADLCNINKEDLWNLHSQDFINDARAVLEKTYG